MSACCTYVRGNVKRLAAGASAGSVLLRWKPEERPRQVGPELVTIDIGCTIAPGEEKPNSDTSEAYGKVIWESGDEETQEADFDLMIGTRIVVACCSALVELYYPTTTLPQVTQPVLRVSGSAALGGVADGWAQRTVPVGTIDPNGGTSLPIPVPAKAVNVRMINTASGVANLQLLGDLNLLGTNVDLRSINKFDVARLSNGVRYIRLQNPLAAAATGVSLIFGLALS